MPRKHTVVVVEHADGTKVYSWHKEDGLITVGHCLKRDEKVKVYTEKMTQAEFEAMDDYEGEC